MARECENYFMIFSQEDKNLVEDIERINNISKERITVLSTQVISQFSLNVLMSFDIILSRESLSESDLIKFKSEQLNTKQESRLKLLLGKNHNWNNLVKVIQVSDETDFNQACIDYMDKLMADKSIEQLTALNSCIKKSKYEDTNSVLKEESIQFFKIMKALSNANGEDIDAR